jgi:hypothetical protein
MIKQGDTLSWNGPAVVTIDHAAVMDPRLSNAAVRIYAALPGIRPPIDRNKLEAYCQAILDEPGDFDWALKLLVDFGYLVESDDNV